MTSVGLVEFQLWAADGRVSGFTSVVPVSAARFPSSDASKNVELCCGSNRWSLKLCSFTPPKPHLRSLNYTNDWNHNEEAHRGFITPSLSWCILISDWRPLEMWLRIWMFLVLAKDSILTPRVGKSQAINLGYNQNHTFTSTWRF